MSRPSAYVTVVRTLLGLVFMAGSLVHLRFALTDTSFYGAFGDTAWPPLDTVWARFVIPNIEVLALLTAVFELVVGIAAWLPGGANRLAAMAMTLFFAFLVILGFAFPTDSWAEDLLVNRLASVVMIALVVPWLRHPHRSGVPAALVALARR